MFRLEVQEKPKPVPPPEHLQPKQTANLDLPLPTFGIQPDQIASFKALGVSVCLESEHIGQIWIVPEYTDNDRLEISVEHAATLSAFCAAFPGATVTAFEKL